MLCAFEPIGDSRQRCGRCGAEYPATPLPLRRQCPASAGANAQMPSLARRAGNFAQALWQHAASGWRQATSEQIAARLAICQACPTGRYIADPRADGWGACGHPDCGCAVGNQIAFRNKLAWADQACPSGHWDPIPADPGADAARV